MNPMHQLTRRPVKAAFGALLLALAGVILALSGGQFWAAVQTRAGVEETYTTVAVVTGGKRQLVSSGDIVYEDIGPTYEANEFLKEAAQKGWSIIRGQATMGLAGGYSPKLTPLTTFYRTGLGESDTRIDSEEDAPITSPSWRSRSRRWGRRGSIIPESMIQALFSTGSSPARCWECKP